jgi:DNA polymerase
MSTSKAQKLEKLRQKMLEDKSLPLREGANNLVFGDGNSEAEILFIGEGPGYWEDKKGIPFVGNAGAFLNQLLHTIEIPREEVFITNVIHYRAPSNRDPKPEEIDAFGVYLDKIIDIIDSKIIVTLGRFSMAKFLPGVTISSVHGKPRVVDWKKRKIVVIPMYHPAAGLRRTEIKESTINDFKKIPGIMTDLDNYLKEEVEDESSDQLSLV